MRFDQDCIMEKEDEEDRGTTLMLNKGNKMRKTPDVIVEGTESSHNGDTFISQNYWYRIQYLQLDVCYEN